MAQSFPQPLIKYICQNSSYSRRDAMSLIQQQQVCVDQVVIGDANAKINSKNRVTVQGRTIQPSVKHYYKFHKPLGTISTFNDPNGRRDLSYHLKKSGLPRTVKPCGRLDADSSGLLLFSNDGDFINTMLHPTFEVSKKYYIELDHPLSNPHKRQLSSGIFLDDGPTQCEFGQWFDATSFEVMIHMGRNRIIRRTFDFFGYTVTRLHRLSIGTIELGNLSIGQFEAFDPTC